MLNDIKDDRLIVKADQYCQRGDYQGRNQHPCGGFRNCERFRRFFMMRFVMINIIVSDFNDSKEKNDIYKAGKEKCGDKNPASFYYCTM